MQLLGRLVPLHPPLAHFKRVRRKKMDDKLELYVLVGQRAALDSLPEAARAELGCFGLSLEEVQASGDARTT